jgi:formylglycine-generating enzyme required for sulfatase activity
MNSRPLFLVLSLLTGFHSALAQPTVGIAPAGNNQSVLFYPVTSTDFILQSATNLSSPNWVFAGDAVPVKAFTVSNTAPAKFYRLTNSAPPAGMVLIPADQFSMGNWIGDSDITDAAPVNVYVSAFYMDQNVVSESLWQTVYSWATNQGYSFKPNNSYLPNFPHEGADWYDAIKWCNARSQMEGLTPVYYTDPLLSVVYKSGEGGTIRFLAANGYQLPTEAQWEKAARGGLSGRRFPWGNLISAGQANYWGNSIFSYDLAPDGQNAYASHFENDLYQGFGETPVGYFDQNGYGLYDMAGDAWQWCWDWYGTPYAGGSNPRGPATGSFRVLRGGNYAEYARALRCANRKKSDPTIQGGFCLRCARGLQ